jgi:hypothetical protein
LLNAKVVGLFNSAHLRPTKFTYRLAWTTRQSCAIIPPSAAHTRTFPHVWQEIIMGTIVDAIPRVRAEYLEMPGLRLKPEQVQRLCGIDQTICQTVLDALVAEHFLCVKPNGHYARVTEGQLLRPQSAKADLRTPARFMNAS